MSKIPSEFFFARWVVLFQVSLSKMALISDTFYYGPNTWSFLKSIGQKFYENDFGFKFNFKQDLFYGLQRYLCLFRTNGVLNWFLILDSALSALGTERFELKNHPILQKVGLGV